ncbi:hypothetical protein F5880DRAFT_1483809 [Lentinula raphanica]|nr:hypothetical protein F5880DRAFT_1483809 [Lentinula raphanica]
MSSSSTSSSSTASPKLPSKRRREESDDDNDDSDSRHTESSSSDSDKEEEDDVPALSHAEKRRQKKKEKLAARKDKEVASPPSKKRKTDSTKGPSDATTKRQNSVWVGNLSFKTTTDALRKFFDGVGEITRINMPMKEARRPNTPAENRGYAYVDFATSDAKIVAITLSERPLLGRKLLIKDGDDFAGRPTLPAIQESSSSGQTHSKTALKILRAQKQPPAPTLFFGNLPFETTEDDIRQLLNAHRMKKRSTKGKDGKEGKAKGQEGQDEGTGKSQEGDKEEEEEERDEEKEEDWIRRIRLGTFEDSGLCKGFAFVDFTNTSTATSALTNPKNHHLNGRNLVVEYASADAVKRGPNKPREPRDKPRAAGPHGSKEKAGHRTKGSRRSDGVSNETTSSRPSRKDKPGPRHGDVDGSTTVHDTPDPTSAGHKLRGRDPDGAYTRHKGPRNRPKPGAALAQAKRQSAAIVPTSGKKIVF